MNRILVFNRLDEYLFDIDPNTVLSAVVTEEINGLHTLDISTTQRLQKSNRIVVPSHTGRWEEYVVVSDPLSHSAEAKRPYGTYHAVWSMQYDLTTVYGDDIESGGEFDVNAYTAVTNALNGTTRWSVGTVSATGLATIEMFGNSAWERLGDVVSAYDGELEQQLTVGFNKVTARAVNFLSHVGNDRPTRRFEWGRDATEIKRKSVESPLFCRIIPVGKSDDVTIEDVNGGVRWIEDSEAAAAYRVRNGSGSGYEYPTKVVKFADIEDDRELLSYATEHIEEYTRPVPTYEATVLQYAAAGMNYQGVALGDVVQIIDRGFSEDAPLRLEGRVHKIVRSLIDETDMSVTIGDVDERFSLSLLQMDEMVNSVKSRLDAVFGDSLSSTAKYLEWLTGQMNTFINALGGYAYIVPGVGIVTYSCEVSDPTVGAEAKALVPSGNGYVTEIRGGAIRIANSLTPSGDWDFRTVLLPGQIAAEMITSANLTTGYVGNASGGNFWNLDNGYFQMAEGLARFILSGYSGNATHYVDVGTVSGYSPTSSSSSDRWSYRGMKIYSSGESPDNTLLIAASDGLGYQASGEPLRTTAHIMSEGALQMAGGVGNSYLHSSIMAELGYAEVRAVKSGSSSRITVNGSSGISAHGDATFYDDLAVIGTKTRRCSTDNYGDRLSYAYETPEPMFGDVGHGTIGDDGFCYVMIDDIFSETVRTDISYSAFVQPCGDGSAFIAEKHPTYFVVSGTPNMAFDWEVKAKQAGYENVRLEQPKEQYEADDLPNPEDAYNDYYSEIEAVYLEDWRTK